MSLPDPQPVLFLIEAFRRSQVMFTAVQLRLFDELAASPSTAADLAQRLGLNADALERLLDTGVALDLFQREQGQYANTPMSDVYLTRASTESIVGYVEYSQRALWRLWAELPNAVREGTHRWEAVFGGQGELFAHYYKTEEEKRQFLMGMHGFGRISSPQIARALDLSGFRHLVDLGGATGHLALAVCAQYPTLRATVFDLPQVLPLAEEMIAREGLSERVGITGGDFFAGPIPACDLVALGRILHDWTEEKIHRLLRKIHDTLPAGGGLLIAEKLLDSGKRGPLWGLLQTLNMLLVTEGKERTLAEYQAILTESGFGEIEHVVLPDSPLDAILARKRT
jgi:acetylserotonin O-methyltransferase